jgi:hypothetical protein
MIKRTIVTTLPTTLAEGVEVYYRDPNGVQTLWVGNAQGQAWPSVGYKELRFIAFYSSFDTTASVSAVEKNDIGATLTVSDITSTTYNVLIGIDRTGPYVTGGVTVNEDNGATVNFAIGGDTGNKLRMTFPAGFEGSHTVSIQIYP